MIRAIHLKVILILLLSLSCASSVWADYVPGAGIAGGPHDFTNPTGPAYQADSHATVCIFCHAALQEQEAATPTTPLMWNHKLSVQNFFWSARTETLGKTPLPSNLATWAGSSKLCLSCHDGTLSVGDVHKAKHPAVSFVGGAAYVDGSGTVPNWISPRGTVDATGKIVADALLIGINGDLGNHHPVGIPYPYGGASGIYNGISTGGAVDVGTYASSPANVQLYTTAGKRIIPGTRAGATGIECATCHDVHNKAVRDRHLLRDRHDQLCTDCHRR